MAAINAQQIKKIYAIGNSLGIVERGNDEDDLHAMVSAMTGKDSIKTLTYREAEDIIARLQHQQGGAAPRLRPGEAPFQPGDVGGRAAREPGDLRIAALQQPEQLGDPIR